MKTFFALALLFFVQSAKADFFSPEMAASNAAAFMNESKTVGGVISALTSGSLAQEVNGVREAFKAADLTLDTALPTAMAKGNKLFLTGTKVVVEFNANRTFTMNGIVHKPFTHGKFDSYLKAMAKEHAQQASILNVLFPEANAAGFGISLAGGSLLVGGIAATAITVGSIVVYVGAEAYQTFKDNSVECNGDYFTLRNKTHNKLWLATSKQTILDSEKVNQAFGKAVSCTSENAAKLQAMFKVEPASRAKVTAPKSAPASK